MKKNVLKIILSLIILLTGVLFPHTAFAEGGTFTASDYSFNPDTHVLQFTASDFNPPRTSEVGEINDIDISLFNNAGDLVLDYFSYNTGTCFQGNLFNLTSVFNQEVCYNEYWHADLPLDNTPVYLRIAQSASGIYRSQPIPANELLTTIPSPSPTPSVMPPGNGRFTASNYHFDPETKMLKFTASNFDPPRPTETTEINDIDITLMNSRGELVLDYYSYNTGDCFEGNITGATTIFEERVCYNEYWHADYPTNDTNIYLRVSQVGVANYFSQPIPASQLISQTPVTISFNSSADTYVRSGGGNRNLGGGTFMRLQSSGDNRSLVQFDNTALQNAVGNGNVLSAKLRVTIVDNGNNWGTTGRTIDVHRLLASWVEGNGTENNRGTGTGATWECALDTNIANQAKDCNGNTVWEMGQPNNPAVHPWVQTATDTEIITNNQSGVVEFDVTSDVVGFLNGTHQNYGWIIKKTNEGQNGQVSFGTKESSLVPQLVITYQP